MHKEKKLHFQEEEPTIKVPLFLLEDKLRMSWLNVLGVLARLVDIAILSMVK